jgi:hypothetical protein
MNFAVQHLLAAARFARASGEIELAHLGEPFGPFFDEIIPPVAAAAIMAAAALEAYINELFSDADVFFPDYRQQFSDAQWGKEWKRIEAKTTLDKYTAALDIKKQPRLNKGGTKSIQRSADSLIKVRHALMHFKPQWDNEATSHLTITTLLRDDHVQISPFLPNTEIFPKAYMCHDMARWSVMTSLRFVEAFSQRSGLGNKYTKFIDRLNPGFPDWPGNHLDV